MNQRRTIRGTNCQYCNHENWDNNSYFVIKCVWSAALPNYRSENVISQCNYLLVYLYLYLSPIFATFIVNIVTFSLMFSFVSANDRLTYKHSLSGKVMWITLFLTVSCSICMVYLRLPWRMKTFFVYKWQVKQQWIHYPIDFASNSL